MVFYYAAVEAGDAGARPYKKMFFQPLSCQCL